MDPGSRCSSRLYRAVFVNDFGLQSPVASLVTTSRSVALSPVRFFSRLPTGEGYAGPLAFALAWGLFAFAAGGFWNFVVPGSPPEFFVATLVASPFVTVTDLALIAVLVHFCLVRRSLGGESAGFGTTFRVCCYASVANVLCVFPIVGFWAAGFWYLFLLAAGVGLAHFEKATYVREVGCLTFIGAWLAYVFLKVIIVGVLYSGVAGLILTGTPAGSGEAGSDALMAIVMPTTGTAYDR